jgi:tetratricopeptide (TPR) repeat protein
MSGSSSNLALDIRELLQQGNVTQAIRLTEAALAEPGNETNGRVVQLHGLTLFVHGDYEAALSALESALLLSPLTAESLTVLANLYVKFGKTEDARVSLNILVEDIHNIPSELLSQIADLLGRVGEPRKALSVCYRLIDNDPDCDAAIFSAAHYMHRVGCAPRQVIAMMRRAFSLDPKNCTYRRALASALAVHGDIQSAYSLFASISIDEICCCNCLRIMNNIFEKFGDWERLQESQRRLLEIESSAS